MADRVQSRPFQFGLLSLFALTTAVALQLVLMRAPRIIAIELLILAWAQFVGAVTLVCNAIGKAEPKVVHDPWSL